MPLLFIVIIPLVAAGVAFATQDRARAQLAQVSLVGGLQIALAFGAEIASGRPDGFSHSPLGTATILIAPWMAVLIGLSILRRIPTPKPHRGWLAALVVLFGYWGALGVALVAGVNLGLIVH